MINLSPCRWSRGRWKIGNGETGTRKIAVQFHRRLPVPTIRLSRRFLRGEFVSTHRPRRNESFLDTCGHASGPLSLIRSLFLPRLTVPKLRRVGRRAAINVYIRGRCTCSRSSCLCNRAQSIGWTWYALVHLCTNAEVARARVSIWWKALETPFVASRQRVVRDRR